VIDNCSVCKGGGRGVVDRKMSGALWGSRKLIVVRLNSRHFGNPCLEFRIRPFRRVIGVRDIGVRRYMHHCTA
jgi:hypothetical protein